MDLGLKDKVALIVGGARGIGYAAAEELAAAGARIAIADIDGDASERSAHKLAKTHAATAISLRMDVTSPSEIAAGIARVRAELGPIHSLLISAAVLDDKLFVDSSEADWRRMIDICLYGPMHVLHAVLPGMIDAGSGHIVCMATDAARVGQARLSYYAASKAGVIALTKSVAQEVGRYNITLNVVSPGATDTELRQERELATKAKLGDEAYAKRTAAVNRMYPLGRIGTPHDHSSLIALLLSDKGSWVTGQVFSINGGFVMP